MFHRHKIIDLYIPLQNMEGRNYHLSFCVKCAKRVCGNCHKVFTEQEIERTGICERCRTQLIGNTFVRDYGTK